MELRVRASTAFAILICGCSNFAEADGNSASAGGTTGTTSGNASTATDGPVASADADSTTGGASADGGSGSSADTMAVDDTQGVEEGGTAEGGASSGDSTTGAASTDGGSSDGGTTTGGPATPEEYDECFDINNIALCALAPQCTWIDSACQPAVSEDSYCELFDNAVACSAALWGCEWDSDNSQCVSG